MRIKHYYCFDKKILDKMDKNSLDANNWDVLRADKTPGAFSIERDIDLYEQNCMMQVEYRKFAKEILEIVHRQSFHNIVSMGIGKGILEWHIKKLCPQLNIECTDYTEKGLQLLKQVFKACDKFECFDMAKGDFSQFAKKDVVIMYRLSTEFSKMQWKEIFDKMYEADIKYIIFVPTEILTIKMIVCEKMRFVLNSFCGRKNVFCGWMYSVNEFNEIFTGGGAENVDKLYEVCEKKTIDNSAIFLLKRCETTESKGLD